VNKKEPDASLTKKCRGNPRGSKTAIEKRGKLSQGSSGSSICQTESDEAEVGSPKKREPFRKGELKDEWKMSFITIDRACQMPSRKILPDPDRKPSQCRADEDLVINNRAEAEDNDHSDTDMPDRRCSLQT
jgi:hypothetical protein